MAVANLLFSFIHVAGWSQHHQSSSRPNSSAALGHIRSLSSAASPTSSSPASPSSIKGRMPLKSPSTSALPNITLTTSASAPGAISDEMSSTLPDPRSRSKSPANNDGSDSNSERHPDLNEEVATLSTKLINAINYQTVLDDSLTATRHELQSSRKRISELESHNASLRDTMRGEVWIRRSTLDAEKKAMHAERKTMQVKLTAEAAMRMDTEKEKRKIEQELENLTAALFEEANKMVIAAKEEAQAQHEILQRKNDQLKAQLADSETLLKSQQEQLSQLKSVMESMATGQDETMNGTAPSSPGLGKFDPDADSPSMRNIADTMSHSVEDLQPRPALGLHSLVQPVLRYDLVAYDDFTNLARVSFGHPSRASSGSYGGMNSLGIGLGGSTFSGSTTSVNTTTPADKSAPQSPNTPASTNSVGSTSGAPLPSLKETRFYKRALTEDIEPTMRLDAAPGLSWLARRTVLSSMVDGSLVVEPIPASPTYIAIAKPQLQPCSLCGESKHDRQYLRNHRFRTSEADNAQRHPLCNYCLNRVRSTCDFLGFLRIVKDGHWRSEDEDQEKAAWEESVRLREQMFWARIGGGLVPVNQVSRPPSDVDEESRRGRNSEDGKPQSTATCATPDVNDEGNVEEDDKPLPCTPPGQTGKDDKRQADDDKAGSSDEK